MAEPPATQAQNTPPIFREEDGHPLRVFVEACGIVNRPKLVRTLKKAGAEISIDPKQAQIILVDSRTYDGRKFIRDWGNDTNKVVLEHTWVTKSLTVGRALREADQWGDCRTHDDGLPLDADGTFDDEADFTNKSPLPTPRVTPVDTSNAKGKIPRKFQVAPAPANASESPIPSSNNSSRVPIPASTLEPPTFMTPESVVFPAASSSFAQSNGLPIAGTDPQIPSNPSFTPQPYQSNAAQSVDLMQQFLQASMTQPVNFMQQMMQPNMMAPMAGTMQIWQMMNAMLSQNNAQFNSDHFAMSLVDAMRNHGMVPNPQTQGPVPNVQQSAPNTSNPPSTKSEDNLTYGPRVPSPQLPSSISHNAQGSKSRVPSQTSGRSGRPGRRRRSPSPVEPPAFSTPQVKKQKRREKSPDNRRKTMAFAGPSRTLHAVDSPPRLSPTKSSQKIFVKDNEEPASFFVQIDQPSRLNLVTLIKKNGGKIESSQTSADYGVLYSQSKTFKDLLKSTIEAGGVAVSASFIHDSMQAGTLVDAEKYRLKLLKKSNKRAARRDSSTDVEELTPAEASAAAAAEQQKLVRNQRKQDRRKQLKEEKAEAVANAQVKPEPEDVQVTSEQRLRIPSPIPPPPQPDQFSLRGRSKYSDLEREYTLQYIKVLLERDHLTSANAMARLLYRKMPHHTLKSWTSYISNYNNREEIDLMRKKAGIAHRKARAGRPPQSVKEEPQEVSFAEVGFSNDVDMDTVRQQDEEDDLNKICNFFAYGGGDEQNKTADQEELWQRLGRRAQCKTADTWQDFYDQHYTVIQERYARLVEGDEAQPTQNDMEII